MDKGFGKVESFVIVSFGRNEFLKDSQKRIDTIHDESRLLSDVGPEQFDEGGDVARTGPQYRTQETGEQSFVRISDALSIREHLAQYLENVGQKLCNIANQDFSERGNKSLFEGNNLGLVEIADGRNQRGNCLEKAMIEGGVGGIFGNFEDFGFQKIEQFGSHRKQILCANQPNDAESGSHQVVVFFRLCSSELLENLGQSPIKAGVVDSRGHSQIAV